MVRNTQRKNPSEYARPHQLAGLAGQRKHALECGELAIDCSIRCPVRLALCHVPMTEIGEVVRSNVGCEPLLQTVFCWIAESIMRSS